MPLPTPQISTELPLFRLGSASDSDPRVFHFRKVAVTLSRYSLPRQRTMRIQQWVQVSKKIYRTLRIYSTAKLPKDANGTTCHEAEALARLGALPWVRLEALLLYSLTLSLPRSERRQRTGAYIHFRHAVHTSVQYCTVGTHFPIVSLSWQRQAMQGGQTRRLLVSDCNCGQAKAKKAESIVSIRPRCILSLAKTRGITTGTEL